MNSDPENKLPFDPLLPPPPLLDDPLKTLDSNPNTIDERTTDFHDQKAERTLAEHKREPTPLDDFPNIPGYFIKRKLGQGGMGAVFLAVDEKLGRLVALKVVSGHGHSPGILARFRSEVETVASLQHPNIAQLFAADLVSGHPYFVMEFVDGPTLDQQLQADAQSPKEAAVLVEKLARAMDYCHSQDIIHRDLKPSNILMDRSSNPKIADFGLAKTLQGDSSSTKTGEILGTPGYMSPEQASGIVKNLGPACDVYGLGAILYRLLTGRAPFVAPEPLQTVMMVLSDEPVAPRKLQKSVPRDLETICLKCLEKKPERRYDSAKDLADDLRRFIDHEPIKARPTSLPERTLKWANRRPAQAVIATACLILIPTVIAWQWLHSVQLNSALADTDVALKKADAELERSRKLASEGSDFAAWIATEHLGRLRLMPGTTNEQKELVARMQRYLDAATPQMPNEVKYVRRQAQAYKIIATIQGNPSQPNLGLTDQSLKNYKKAIEIYDLALDIDPDDFTTKKLRLSCLLSMAEVIYEVDGATAYEKMIRDLQKKIDALQADGTGEIVLLKMTTQQGLVFIESSKNNFDQTLVELQKMEDVIKSFPAEDRWQEEREHQRIWIAGQRSKTYQAMGQYRKAKEQSAIGKKLASQSYDQQKTNPLVVDRYAGMFLDAGDAEFYLEDIDAAMKEYQSAVDLRRELVRLNPNDAAARKNLATAISRIGDVYQNRNDSDGVLKTIDEVIQIRRQLVKNQPDNREFQRDLWVSLNNLGSSFLQRQQFKKAIAIFDEQLALIDKLNKIETPEVADMFGFAQCSFNKAGAYIQMMLADASISSGDTPVREVKEYQLALKHADDSLAMFDQIEKRGPLASNQKNFRETVRKFKKTIIEYAEQVEKAKDKNFDRPFFQF